MKTKQILFNGETREIRARTVQELLKELDQNGQFAIAINEQFVPKSLYAQTGISEGDSLELVMPMQGG